MSNISLDLSGKLPPSLIELHRRFNHVTNELGLNRWLLVGAQARDLVFGVGFDLFLQRVTKDVDFAVGVTSWRDFDKLHQALIASGHFTSHPQMTHRLFFSDKTPVDVVPFGPLENPPGTITWPPDFSIEMRTVGFSEVFTDALLVRLADDVEVKAASPAGLALLKTISWNDRRSERDAQDLGYVLAHYLDAGNAERLYGENAEHADLLDENFDYESAGGRMLGRDVRRLLTPETRRIVDHVFEDSLNESGQWALAVAMIKNNANFNGDLDKARSMLKMLQRGIDDIPSDKTE